MNDEYARTVQLLLAVAPSVFETAAFAMKGGTALRRLNGGKSSSSTRCAIASSEAACPHFRLDMN